jgi:hypothetical protein
LINRRWLALGVATGFALVAITTAYAAIAAKGPFQNPDAGLTDAQRDANYANGRADFEARYAQWVASLDVNTLDLSSLQHVELNVIGPPGQPSLQAAKSKADRIVVGHVTAIKPTVNGTVVSVAVSRTLKGDQRSVIEVRQSSGLRPTSDWKGVVIADSPGEPLMLPGVRAELFLQASSDGMLRVQSVTGMYLLTASGVKALELNPFGSSVNGLPEDTFENQTLG